jgi:DegV family protein with EDD domain
MTDINANEKLESETKDKKVAIVTDSVAQVPPDLARELDISVISYIVNADGKSYYDGIDLAPQELYHRMRLDKKIPTTAAPSPAQYLDAFRSRLKAGYKDILCVSLGSKLSNAYAEALIAADQLMEAFPGSRIEVLDSQQATISEGFIAIAAAKAAREGKTLPEVKEIASKAIERSGFAAKLDTLEYLALGGRIGKAAYMAGSLIDIKPILVLQNAVVTPVKVMRNNAAALKAIVDYVARKVGNGKKIFLAIMEADAAEEAAKLEELALKRFKPEALYHSEFTPVMGVHTGPGLVGLAYYYEEG